MVSARSAASDHGSVDSDLICVSALPSTYRDEVEPHVQIALHQRQIHVLLRLVGVPLALDGRQDADERLADPPLQRVKLRNVVATSQKRPSTTCR